MKKLNEVLGAKLLDADVGIEIECEGRNISPINSSFWKTEDDGSLRGEYPHERAEFVLKKPIKAVHVDAALDRLIAHQEEAHFNFSYRTSVHVHVNCLHMDVNQLLTFAYSYLIFETVLLNYCGEGRKGNRFCLRLRDAEAQLNIFNWLIKDGIEQVLNINGDANRYAAMNLASLPKYGSIEFRAMRGNLDKEVLSTWVTCLLELREFASKYPNPKKLYEAVAEEGVEGLFVKAFPTTHEALRVPDMKQDILESVSLSIEIPFEWEKRNKSPKAQLTSGTYAMPLNFEEMVGERVAEEIRRARARQNAQVAAPVGMWRAAPVPVPGRADVMIMDDVVNRPDEDPELF